MCGVVSEWALRCGLWGHALQLAGERRARALLAARFLAGVPARDPLHTLYAALAARMPPAVTAVSALSSLSIQHRT